MNKTSTPDNSPKAYVLRVSIAQTTPLIWRKLSVPGDYTLGDLHRVLQIAFGWDNDHMHDFTIGSARYGMTEIEGMDLYDDADMIDEDSVRLDDLELRPKRKFTYLYDFGDSWEHDITVSRIDPVGDNKELARPLCLEGERAGPLEDSGGVWGYENMLEILKNPDHEEYEDTREWAGNYDSEHFDPEEINASLKRSFNT